jgi:hypothetical protein
MARTMEAVSISETSACFYETTSQKTSSSPTPWEPEIPNLPAEKAYSEEPVSINAMKNEYIKKQLRHVSEEHTEFYKTVCCPEK